MVKTTNKYLEMRSYFFYFLSFFCLLSTYTNAEPVHIGLKIPQLHDRKVFLCSHFSGLVYTKDSLDLSPSGEGVFLREKNYEDGIYLLYLTKDKSIDFLLADDQDFSITIADTADIVGQTQIAGSEQSEVFQSYTRFLHDKRAAQEQIISRYRALSEKEKEQSLNRLQKQLDDLSEEVEQFQTNLIARHKDQWVGMFFQSILPVTTGPHPNPKTQEEFNEEFNYQKEHFFDHVNLHDSRFWWTNSFPQKVVEYMEKQVEQDPDSLAAAASRLVAKTRGDSISFQLMMDKLIHFSANSRIMGMENIWAKLLEDYYHKGLFIRKDSAYWANLEFEYKKLRYNRIGMKAHDLVVQNSAGEPVKLCDTSGKYTLLYFYEPSCSHCAEMTPEIYERIYKKYAGKGLDIIAFCTAEDKNGWLDFIKLNHLEGDHWYNFGDPERRSYFWLSYDVSSTPSIYLLDENKKIIARKLDVESTEKMLQALQGF
jgi:thiol-disulfide isomerase/thioredoxin